MYKVNDTEFLSFLAAVKYAKTIDANVIEIETGLQRWTPTPKVSNKRMLKYLGQKNAHDAYQKMLNSNK